MSSSDEHVSWDEGLYHDPLPIGGIAVALMLGTYGLLQLPVSVPLLVAGGCGAALVYGLDRGLLRSPEDAISHPRRRAWMRAHRTWILGEAILFGGSGAVALTYLQTDTLLLAGGIAAVAGLHVVPVGHTGRPLKALGWGKPLAVAGAWAVGSTLLPVVEAGASVGSGKVALVGYRFLFVVPNVLLADWADRAGDAAVGLQTWADGWTRRRLQVVLTVLLGIGAAGAVGVVYEGASLLLLVDAAGLLAMIGAVWTLRPGASSRQRFLLDAVVAWPIVVWIVGIVVS